MVFVEMRYSFRTSGKTTASFKSNVLGILFVLCCFCFYAVSCTSTSESSLNPSSPFSGNVDNSTVVEELSLLTTTNPTFIGQNVTSTESPVLSSITPSPSTPVIDQASLITTTDQSEAANSTIGSSSAVASTASSAQTVSSSSSSSEQSETNSTPTDISTLAQTVTSSSPIAQSATPSSTVDQTVTSTSFTPQSVTPTSSTVQSVTPTSSIAQSVTPTSSTAQSVTPTSSTAQSVTPTSSTAQSVTPTSSTAQSVSPASSTAQSVTPSVTTVSSITVSSTKAPTVTTSTVSVSKVTTSSTVSSVPSTQTVSTQSTLSESLSTTKSQNSSTESSSLASPVPSTAVPTENNQSTTPIPSTQTVTTESSPNSSLPNTSQIQSIGSTSSSSPQIEKNPSVSESTVSTVPSTTTFTTTPSTSSVSSTTANIQPTESSNTTENIFETQNITTTTVKPILSLDGSASFDPSSILTFAQNFAQNTSKFVLKYVSKEQNGTNSTKQSGKYSFKDFGDGTNYTKFYAKYLTKNVETMKEDKFADFMPDDIRNKGGVVVHMILLVYVCFSLGIICDLYFLTSIEYIGNSLNLPSDIAGATFMALGTSAPELFIALIGVFIVEDDIGTSTIIGSAVFNLIFVPSVCGYAIYLSRMIYPKINKYSIMRDAIFYLVAIITLLLVLKDNEVDWIESLGMLSLYCIYVFILYLNAELGEIVDWEDEEEVDTSSRHSSTASTDSEITPLISQSRNLVDRQLSKSDKYNFTKSVDWMETGRSRANSIRTIPLMRRNSIRTSSIRNGSICNVSNNAYLPIGKDSSVKLSTKPLPLLPKPSPDEEPSGMPENWTESNLLLKILMFPVVLLIKLTVPKPNRNNYYLTFLISIIWISGFTYISVWLVTIIGKTFGLPSSVLGLTILAAGSSIPEVISSVIVVKRAGLANMALCNLFGSNIFDVLVCLGLPWLIKSIIQMVTIGSTELALSVVTVQSNGLLLSVFILLVCVVSFVLTLSYSKWKFGLAVGVMCSIIYFTAITVATISEIMLN